MKFHVVFSVLAIELLWNVGVETTMDSDTKNSTKVYVNVTGDIILGALFPIHRRGYREGLEMCGRIQTQDGIQPLEALLYTINKINEDKDILPGVNIGILAMDSCDSNIYALERSLDFIKGFIAHTNQFHQREFECSDGTAAKFLNGRFDKIVGVIGGQSSSVSIQVANLLRLFQIPQISYMSTSPQLSNRERFPYFFRTVPSDINQAHAILEILRHYNIWDYVAVVYSDSEYGVHCYETLRDVAVNHSICFTTPQRVIRDQFEPKDYDQIIKTIKNKNISVIILILEKEYTMMLMSAARRLNVGHKYVWLGTDLLHGVSEGNEDIMEGAIAIQPLVSHVEGFDHYFKELNLTHNEINPWFKEFWEDNFECNLTSEVGKKCADGLKIGTNDTYKQQSFIHFVRDAAYAFAYALHNIHIERCNGSYGMCEKMQHIDGLEISQYLQNVTFKDEENNKFEFVNKGDGPTRYTIINFRKWPNKTYGWLKVGNYSKVGNSLQLNINHSLIRYRNASNGIYPSSTCSEPCETTQVKIREMEDTCCWTCKSCGPYQIKIDEFQCEDCEIGTSPNENLTVCLNISAKHIGFDNPWAIGAMSFSSLGILVTLFVGGVFLRYNETPIIKAAGRELSYLLLLGILMSFGLTFLILMKPSDLNCGLMRFFLGFCPSLCYSAIVTKTNRIARIFHHKPGSSTPKAKFISPSSQMIIVGLLTSIDVLISICWIVIDPPRIMFIYPPEDRDLKLEICSGLENNYSYVVGFIYPIILIGFCTIYAIQTRKCPGGFNETKYIAFTNYTMIIIWIAFVPLYLASTVKNTRVITLGISLSLSALVELFCLFFPKIYIVLFKPEKNTKEVVMAPNRSSFPTLSTSASATTGPSQLTSQTHFYSSPSSNSLTGLNNTNPPITLNSPHLTFHNGRLQCSTVEFHPLQHEDSICTEGK